MIAWSRSRVVRAQRAVNEAAGELAPVLVAVVLVIPVIAAGLFYVWSRVASVRIGYDLSATSEVHRTLIEENRGLRIEVASLKNPKRLEKLAKDKYGLAPPKAEQIIRLAPVPRAGLDGPGSESLIARQEAEAR